MGVEAGRGDGDGGIAGEPGLERLEQAGAVLRRRAGERERRVGVDAGGSIEVAGEQRVGRMGIEAAAAAASTGARRDRAGERVVREDAAGGDVERGEREAAHLEAPGREQVAVAGRARLVLVRLDEPGVDEGAQALGEHPARQARLAGEVGEPRAGVSWMASRIHIVQRSATSSRACRRSGPTGTSSIEGFRGELTRPS